MKIIIITLIQMYQIVVSPILKLLFGVSSQCRYTPTCSEYAKQSVSKYGIVKGLQMGLIRILSCQPFSKRNKEIKILRY